jgi:hypothetical protein
MIKTPFIGKYYTKITPTLILVMAIFFAILGTFKQYNKMVDGMQLYQMTKELANDNIPSRVEKKFK